MKNIVLVVMFFGLNLNAQSLESFGLKGKVKSIQEELKMCSHNYGKAQIKDCSSLTSEKQFTKEGYLLEYKDSLKIEGVTRKKEKTSTGWLETVYNNEDSKTIKLAENYYDKKDLMYKTISYDESGEIFNTTEYFHNDAMMLIRLERNTLNDEGFAEKAVSFFDQYGTFCGLEFYLDNKLNEKYQFDIQYQFDEIGNWVQSIVTTEFSTNIHNRTITYY